MPTDAARLKDPVAAVARLPRSWQRGAPPFAVIVRESDRAKREALATALRPLCRARGVRLVIANDPALAARLGAGVHLSEPALARRAIGIGAARRPHAPVRTAAAHSYTALLRAARRGVDGVLLSPVFPTRSHPGATPLGPLRFAALIHALRRRGIRTGVIALGGVTPANAVQLARAGAQGLAAIGALA